MNRLGAAHRWFPALRAAAVLMMCIGLLGCGKKEMPSPPRQIPPQPVTDLRARLTGNRVELSWSFSKTLSGSKMITGFGVYRAKESVSEGCVNCPFLFEHIGDVPFVEDAGDPAVMTFADTLEKGYRYRYKVIGYSKGLTSKDSNIVLVEEE